MAAAVEAGFSQEEQRELIAESGRRRIAGADEGAGISLDGQCAEENERMEKSLSARMNNQGARRRNRDESQV